MPGSPRWSHTLHLRSRTQGTVKFDEVCPFPWLQDVDGAQVDEVLEELSDSFTFKDFRKGWNYADYSEFPKWHEERMKRLCATTQAEAQPLAPLGLGGRTPRRSQSHPTVSLPPWRDRREGRPWQRGEQR
ncbi:unnamed protein product [Symbiodinium sp. CCMP2456]|nr:unnamed protein product [Symbiodinium sp. CCMP2456]